MDLDWEYSHKNISWEELSNLYSIAPLGKREPKNLEKVFSTSMFKCFVRDKGNIIGVGRALADGADCSYICDVAVLPTYQGRGIGGDIVKKLIELSKGHKKIILYSSPGAELFYKKLGFNRMSTAMAIFEDQNKALETGLTNKT
ncbi:MAG TPA: GNAT family N-acetyltransferase [Hydrogenothermaceae bacterium]|nr:GNAT family N-acetyltransferase [Hydrogenothermaceae bacterium]